MTHFTPGELEVMQVLWRHGPLKPAEMQARFPRSIRNAALRSVLLVLLEKGHVRRRRVGRAYIYEAATPQTSTLRTMTRRLADVFSAGSSRGLIAQLIEQESLSEEDVRVLRRLLSEKTKGRSGKKEEQS